MHVVGMGLRRVRDAARVEEGVRRRPASSRRDTRVVLEPLDLPRVHHGQPQDSTTSRWVAKRTTGAPTCRCSSSRPPSRGLASTERYRPSSRSLSPDRHDFPLR
jgi:hypothetical protein